MCRTPFIKVPPPQRLSRTLVFFLPLASTIWNGRDVQNVAHSPSWFLRLGKKYIFAGSTFSVRNFPETLSIVGLCDHERSRER